MAWFAFIIIIAGKIISRKIKLLLLLLLVLLLFSVESLRYLRRQNSIAFVIHAVDQLRKTNRCPITHAKNQIR